jgi:predicted transcriptional regulator of viral defense system
MNATDNTRLVPETWSLIITRMNEMLAAPSAAYPNTRWLSATSLRQLLVNARKAVGAPESISGTKLLASLEACGMAKQHTFDSAKPNGTLFKVYCLDVGGEPPISPMELLAATQSNFEQTAICYFTALEYHQLTTQIAPHHHIAQLKDYPPNEDRSRETATPVAPPPMGTVLLRHDEIPYYVSKRDRLLAPGIQTVLMAPHFMAHITTLEQTLLDTLHRPWSCGGPSVVFEAWEQAVSQIDESRLANYLEQIASPDLYRRTGYMLDQYAYTVSDPALRKSIVAAKAAFVAAHASPVPLLPYVPQQTLNQDWGLLV